MNMDISAFLQSAVQKKASDIFFSVGSPVRFRIEGEVHTVGKASLSAQNTQEIARYLMTEAQATHFKKNLEIDFSVAFSQPFAARFRVNVFKQQGVISLVLRYIKAEIPDFDTLHLPAILKQLIMRRRGLLIMVGATGAGKSTTLAALIDHRNQTETGHILTIEDPIEYVYQHKKSLINQRELGLDTLSYANALRGCLRESPDVIFIGEIRDIDTMDATLKLATTGHLVVSTLHANNSYQAIQRILSLYPQMRHQELLLELSLNLVAIASQRLVMSITQQRIAAVEVMINTPSIADLILKGELYKIHKAMSESGREGMQTFDISLAKLYKQKLVTLEEVLNSADSSSNLEALLRFNLKK